MPCGITGDYIDKMLKSTEKGSDKGLDSMYAILRGEGKPGEAEAGGDQEEAKGGTDGRV